MSDARLPKVRQLGFTLLATGLRAGSTYPEVWIRDTNTFIESALAVNQPSAIRQALLNFLLLQGPDGDIVDGYVQEGQSTEPPYRRSAELPGMAAFKNTVETDQESSLVSAFRKYVDATKDRGVLNMWIDGMTVRKRLDLALSYPLNKRFDEARGLIWGGASVDWGDVQPEDYPGTHIDQKSHPACAIYNNAMLVIAIGDYLALVGETDRIATHWSQTRSTLHDNIRNHLWDSKRAKFIPHLYLHRSPFPPSFDEGQIYYHGGTAIAIEAGLLERREIAASLASLRQNVRAASAGSIGLTIYPTYPSGYYQDPILREPYTYQNGGDWCWFGARMVQQLVRYGFVEDAYLELGPMLDRILRVGDFHEWWSRDNQPRGAGKFRGGAGVIIKAIDLLTDWAKHQQGPINHA